MTCPECRLQLDDHIDGELRADQAAAVDTHLRACPACRTVETQLRELIATAAALPLQVSPPRDLWPDIAARVVRVPAQGQVYRTQTPLFAFAAAAAVVFALSGVLAMRVAREPAPSATTSPSGVAMHAAVRTGEVLLPEREYERATAALMEAVEARRETLSPETQEAVTKNLKVIDDALAELRSALDSDPGNEELAGLFSSTQRRKVDVLQRVVRLSL